ncbi:apolipoprotein C-II [Clupea harengus]|uniref:Apolipoprotein C-II n=1 Tax=Clupea harengus TaxID=7950 RepID=A0A8M1KQR9_CLUHA|nr:apolipoprotein C-II [Clupea harengus]
MRNLLVIAVLIALCTVGAESFRVRRQDTEEEGTMTLVMDSLKGYYDTTITTASGYLDNLKGMRLEEKAKNLFEETTTAVKTYGGILQDQLYHLFTQSH